MRYNFVQIFSVAAIGAALALGAPPASAKTAKECKAAYAADKDAIKASGQTEKAYIAACRAGADAAAPAAAAPAAPMAAPAADAAPAGGKTAKACAAEYSANKAAIKAVQKKAEFISDCRAGKETIPTAAEPAAPMAAPAAAAPAPAAPAPAAAAPAAPAPMAPKAGAAVAGGFASDAQAKAKCPSDTVVWMNTKSHIYHFAGTHDYGNTKQGTYMCEMDAKGAGRAAENEKHP